MTRNRIGGMRQRLSLERPVRTAAGGGAADVAWQTVATVFAELVPSSARETFDADLKSAQVTHKVRMRYRPDVEADMRFTAGDRIFDIRSAINEDERGRWLICLCREQRP